MATQDTFSLSGRIIDMSSQAEETRVNVSNHLNIFLLGHEMHVGKETAFTALEYGFIFFSQSVTLWY